MVKMRAPAGCTSMSFGGESYTIIDGFVVVPDAALIPLMAHGFVHAPEAPAALPEESDEGGKRPPTRK
jgi:hypothetical protein